MKWGDPLLLPSSTRQRWGDLQPQPRPHVVPPLRGSAGGLGAVRELEKAPRFDGAP